MPKSNGRGLPSNSSKMGPTSIRTDRESHTYRLIAARTVRKLQMMVIQTIFCFVIYSVLHKTFQSFDKLFR